ncbi:MAG: hypothetical protein H7A33_03380 [Deltaproteobacteria bacterium]|nr:hypothetical protein [Deltaproteobacteria bacterium]
MAKVLNSTNTLSALYPKRSRLQKESRFPTPSAEYIEAEFEELPEQTQEQKSTDGFFAFLFHKRVYLDYYI